MSDYSTATHKACSQADLSNLLADGESLMSHKVSSHGLTVRTEIMVNEREADDEIGEDAGKYAPAIAIRILKKPPAMTVLEKKRTALKKSLGQLEGNGGRSYILNNRLIGSSGFNETAFYEGSVFNDVIQRVLKSKSNTKSCRKCGHTHNTNPTDFNINVQGCNSCLSQSFLFTESDRKKHCSALNKLGPVEAELASIEKKRTEKLEDSINSKNWYWFIGAGTKSIAEDLRGYED
jgi:hypothetical protein